MIIEEVSEGEFIDRFTQMNRENNFSYEGRKALYNYLYELSEEMENKQIELDVIAICCDFTEYKDLNEYLNDMYSTEEINEKIKEILGEEETKEIKELTKEQREDFKEAIMEEIRENTQLIEIEGEEGFIIQNY